MYKALFVGQRSLFFFFFKPKEDFGFVDFDLRAIPGGAQG